MTNLLQTCTGLNFLVFLETYLCQESIFFKFWCSTLFLSHFVYNLNETFTGESTLYFDAFLLTVVVSPVKLLMVSVTIELVKVNIVIIISF